MENQPSAQPNTTEQTTDKESQLIVPVDQPGKPMNKILISIIGIILVSLIAAASYYFYVQGYTGKRVNPRNESNNIQPKKEDPSAQISILEQELEPVESEGINQEDFSEIDSDLNNL